MSGLLTSYAWPPSRGESERPVWAGNAFSPSGAKVLSYSERESHWSAELTELHEAEAGSRHPIDVASRQLAVEAIRKHCANRDALILDVGCSSGYLLEELTAHFPSHGIVGADYIAKPLRDLAARISNVPLLQFDLRDCPLPSGSFDAVIALNVLEHIDDDERALSNIARILKPGGIAHIEVPAGAEYFDIYDEVLMHHRRYARLELLEKAVRSGLEAIHYSHLGFFVFPLFAVVKRKNQKLLSLAREEKIAHVSRQIRNTRRSPGLTLILKLEALLGRWISYPVGIRCVGTFRKSTN